MFKIFATKQMSRMDVLVSTLAFLAMVVIAWAFFRYGS